MFKCGLKREIGCVELQTQAHVPLQPRDRAKRRRKVRRRGLASEICNGYVLSSAPCAFLFRWRVYTDNCAYSMPEIGREQNENFCMSTHNSNAILSSFLWCILSSYESLEAFTEASELFK